MRLDELGEKRVLERLMVFLDRNALNLNDDAAAQKVGEGFIIVNIDTLVGSTDILPGTSPRQVGFKVVTMTTSDIVAKGGKPIFFMASINAMGDTQVGFLEEIEKGMRDACSMYGIKFFGGDLNESRDLVISGVSVGFNTSVVSRKGAKPGDTVWATGEFGYNGVSFHYLLEDGVPIKGISRIIRNTIEKKLTVKDGSPLKDIATASMDSSDGLAITLNTLSEINNVKLVIEKIPIPSEVYEYSRVNNIRADDLALFAGEEFEVIFTTNKPDSEVIKTFEKYGVTKLTKIGRVEDGFGVYYKGEKIEPRGWEHFKKER